MFTTSKGKSLDITKAKEIAAGGEGRIYEHPTDKKKVIKIYHQPRKNSYAKHLQLLSKLGNHFVEPQEIYFDSKQQCVGFDMDYVNFSGYWLFNKLFNKGFCNSNGIDKAFKIKVLKQLAECVEELHSKDIIIGDLNQYNLFVGKKGDILFVDCDSYASKMEPHGGVLLDDIRDWTTMDINKSTDTWAYDILTFWSLTFCHPFKWVVPGNKDSLEVRVKNNMSFLRPIKGMIIPALYEAPTGEVKKQFDEIFSGRRYMVDLSGQHIQTNVQIKQPTSSTSLEIRELYEQVTNVFTSGNYITAKIAGTWHLLETQIPKVTRIVDRKPNVDVFLPGKLNGMSATINKGILYGIDGKPTTFYDPAYYFTDGSLMVIDYAKDMQYNYDLNLQMSGISNNSLIVFSKSITIMDTPIQNFGAKKYMNIPIGRSYNLIELAPDTKNAIYCDGFWVVECKKRSKISYSLFSKTGSMDIDHLPYFTVKDKMVFIPNNGYIDVYKDFSLILKLDCPVSTKDSRMFSTGSGLMLLENNILYLLNTK